MADVAYAQRRAIDAQVAIDAHQAGAGLEEGNGNRTELWHLVYSLLHWCDEHAVDFDEVVSDVRAELRTGV